MSDPIHPGEHIRRNVLPLHMTVAEAAHLVGVGRQAFSNLVNAKAALSPDMAERVARAFGVDAAALLDMQAAFDANAARRKGAASATRAYVPPFMQFKAREIEEWGSSIPARSRFAVFIRTLVHSTAHGLTLVDFPGNDDAEKRGWDGSVEAAEASPWTPAGRSGWELGVNADIDRKANSDFNNRVGKMSAAERAELNFVFVTPRSWANKTAWLKAKRAEGKWRGVYAFDAGDLEQWLEQSIPGQAWLAAELKRDTDGVLSLDACWERFKADSEPALAEALFDEAVNGATLAAVTRLNAPDVRPMIVTADSTDEALAFLHCLFGPTNADLYKFRDSVVVFTKPGPLARLASKAAPFIAVAAHRDVEKELAPFSSTLKSFVVYPRNAVSADPDIALRPLSYEAFEKAMTLMGCNRDEVQRWSYESGRSLTVLRRRLSRRDGVRNPDWAIDAECAAALAPFMFAGAWRSTNPADQAILKALAGDIDYPALERRLAAMHQLDDAPVWSLGEFRGVISKTDALFAIARSITRDDIDRFFAVAKRVLGEDDPALDLPEEERWAADIHGKKRQISSALRDGIAESMVLLAVHGDMLLRARTGVPVEARVKRTIEGLLTPVTVRKLEAQSNDLPVYAEAAPDEFLDIIEDDLRSEAPESVALMRPASTGLFSGGCPRTGLLWALEGLAWSSEQLPRVILILARLSEPAIDDNWVNKPSGSLSAIFHHWMPQTGASIAERKRALDLLAKRFPRIAWAICIEQIDGSLMSGHYSHKPRWRTDGHGKGEPVTDREAREFVIYAVEKALDWPAYDREMLAALVACVGGLEPKHQTAIWTLVETWSATASDEDKVSLREKIRVSTLTRRAARRRRGALRAETVELARKAYDALTPKDVLLRHAWLFQKHWVEESADEMDEEEIDFRKRDERIIALRKDALAEVLAERGIAGVIALAESGEAAGVVGWLLPKVRSLDDLTRDLADIVNRNDLSTSVALRAIANGALSSLEDEQQGELLTRVADRISDLKAVEAFQLFPFKQATWALLEKRSPSIQDAYWRAVYPSWSRQSRVEFSLAIEKLIAVRRPRAAFNMLHLDFEQVEPRQLYDLMVAIVSSSEEAPKTFQLDRYDIRCAFEILNKSETVPEADMAALELHYINALEDHEEGRMPNLERHIEKNPALFVQAVAFAYKRGDNGEDPPELRVDDPDERSARAMSAYKLLKSLSRVPGRDRHGKQAAEDIEAWVEKARAGCKELARSKVGDSCIGKLFSTAPVDPEDGVWPVKPVRDALENVATTPMSEGVVVGLMNARGVHWRGAGGDQERELAEQYASYAEKLRYTHPRVARMMGEIAANYRSEAHWQDSESDVRERLRH
jgi:addiction module HigA family antidote